MAVERSPFVVSDVHEESSRHRSRAPFYAPGSWWDVSQRRAVRVLHRLADPLERFPQVGLDLWLMLDGETGLEAIDRRLGVLLVRKDNIE